jgi:hypothetical protein
MRRATLTLLILAFVVTGVSAADEPPRVSLTLLPDTILPGLPAGFLLTITNLSARPEVIAQAASLKVTGPSGTFNALGLRGSPMINLPSDQMEKCNSAECFTLPPNGQRQLYLRFGPLLVENEFFADRRLSSPGRYALEVTLLVLNLPGSDMSEIHSDTQTLTIQQPAGADLAVYNFLQQTSGGRGWIPADWLNTREAVIRQIRTAYQTSGYIAWLGAINLDPRASLSTELAQLDSALGGNPPAAVRDELLLAKGGLLQGASDSASFSERDADKAATLAGQARVVLTQLVDVALTDYTRSHAADALSHLLTPALALANIQFLAALDAPAPARVVPRVECVTKGAGQSFSARFGYSNPNCVIKVLQIGADNQVTPAPRQQGQPLVFKPGDHASVFVGTSPGGELKWHLDGSTATATADFSTRCTP